MHRRGGFTLIELLVVIAIIALLMSILLPAIDRVKIQSKSIVCQSNLHQWAVIFGMFTGDNDGKFMSGGEYDGPPSEAPYELEADRDDHAWWLILAPYYTSMAHPPTASSAAVTSLSTASSAAVTSQRSFGLLCCPTANKPPVDKQGHRTRESTRFSTWGLYIHYDDNYVYGSYGFNSWCYNRGSKTEGGVTVERWGRIPTKNANRVPVVRDCYWCEGYPRPSDQAPAYADDPHLGTENVFMMRFCVDRHRGRSNGLFGDLSVRSIWLTELWDLYWYPGWTVSTPVFPAWMLQYQ
ncbi:MAG TPA: type II secretion system protein [Sedimentisphaerales bacterium]|nr:type II secretion system protein [Sedimentisphaerales bacterium]